jgi:hypothetical protein
LTQYKYIRLKLKGKNVFAEGCISITTTTIIIIIIIIIKVKGYPRNRLWRPIGL